MCTDCPETELACHLGAQHDKRTLSAACRLFAGAAMSFLRSAVFAVAVITGILAVGWPYLPFATVADGGCPLVSLPGSVCALYSSRTMLSSPQGRHPAAAGLRQRRRRQLAIAARPSRHLTA